MSIPRFVLARADGNTVTLRDTQKQRLAAVFLRDTSLPEDKADVAAVAMAETCAAALNLRCEAAKRRGGSE